MALIQNLPTSTIQISSKVIRKVATITVAPLAVVAFVLAGGWSKTSDALGSMSGSSASTYFVVMTGLIAALAVIGAWTHALEGDKQQFDIR
jgi:hypothetical protein